jgi:hypothetical protein
MWDHASACPLRPRPIALALAGEGGHTSSRGVSGTNRAPSLSHSPRCDACCFPGSNRVPSLPCVTFPSPPRLARAQKERRSNHQSSPPALRIPNRLSTRKPHPCPALPSAAVPPLLVASSPTSPWSAAPYSVASPAPQPSPRRHPTTPPRLQSGCSR